MLAHYGILGCKGTDARDDLEAIFAIFPAQCQNISFQKLFGWSELVGGPDSDVIGAKKQVCFQEACSNFSPENPDISGVEVSQKLHEDVFS